MRNFAALPDATWQRGRHHTLDTSALINEAYLKLVDARGVDWQNRAHFFAVSAQAMRRILVDFARARRNLKRGGGVRPLSLDEALVAAPDRAADVNDPDEGAAQADTLKPRQSRVGEDALLWRLDRRGGQQSPGRFTANRN